MSRSSAIKMQKIFFLPDSEKNVSQHKGASNCSAEQGWDEGERYVCGGEPDYWTQKG